MPDIVHDPVELLNTALIDELFKLKASLPLYAIWEIRALELIFDRYAHILIAVTRANDYRSRCTYLTLSLIPIQGYITHTIVHQDWQSFNRASMHLSQDIDELLLILE